MNENPCKKEREREREREKFTTNPLKSELQTLTSTSFDSMAKRKTKAKPKSKKEDEKKKKKKMMMKEIMTKKPLLGPSSSSVATMKEKASPKEDMLRNVSYIRKTRSGMERSTVPSGSAQKKRKGTTLEEHEQRAQSSAFLDKLLGERNDDLAKFARAIVHFQQEEQSQLSMKYNSYVGEEDDFPIQGDGSFSERDEFDDDASTDDDKHMDAEANANANAGVDADAEADETETMVGGRGRRQGVLHSTNSFQPAAQPQSQPQPQPHVQLRSQTHYSHSASEGRSPSAPVDPSFHESCAQSGVGDCISRPRRKRGRTRNPKVATLRPGEKLQLQTFGNTVVGEHSQSFVTQCGVWARERSVVPLQVKYFNRITQEQKDRMWQVIQEKFEFIPEVPNVDIKKIAIGQLRKSFSNYRSDLRRQYYNKYKTDQERLQHPPPEVPLEDWRYLLNLWGTPEFQAVSKQNKANRSKHGAKHTAGSLSYQRKRYKMIQEGHEPDRVEFFKITHTRKDGSAVDKSSEEAMAKMLELTIQALQGSISLTPDEIFEKVMGPKRNSRVRGHWNGLTPTSLFGPSLTRQEFQREVEERMQVEVARAKEQMQVQVQAEAHALVQAQVQAEVAQAKADMQTQMAEMQAQMLAHQAQMQRMMEQMSKKMRFTR